MLKFLHSQSINLFKDGYRFICKFITYLNGTVCNESECFTIYYSRALESLLYKDIAYTLKHTRQFYSVNRAYI